MSTMHPCRTALRTGRLLSVGLRFLQTTSANFQTINVVGAPFAEGQPHSGVALGPQTIRSNLDIANRLEIRTGRQVVDHGDVDPDVLTEPNLGQNEDENLPLRTSRIVTSIQYAGLLSDKVGSIMGQQNSASTILTLGGDHSIALGSINGHLKSSTVKSSIDDDGEVKVLWIDAHADINTHQSSASGNAHGMPLSFVLATNDMVPLLDAIRVKFGDKTPSSPSKFDVSDQCSVRQALTSAGICPRLPVRNLAYIGLRDVDPLEAAYIDAFNIFALSMDEVRSKGIEECVRLAFAHLQLPFEFECSKRPVNRTSSSLHVSFDIDAIDSEIVPATGTPVPDGLTLSEAVTVARLCDQTGSLRAFDLVEINPELGHRNSGRHGDDGIDRTLACANQVLISAFGGRQSTADREVVRRLDSLATRAGMK